MKQLLKDITPAPIWSLLKRARLSLERSFYQPHIVHHHYGGWDLDIRIADPLGAAWYDHDCELPEMAELMKGKLRAGATIFEIGAHQGVVAAVLAKTVGPSGKVIALEAASYDAGIAEINAELNKLHHVTVLNAAGAAQTGHLSFSMDGHVDRGDKGPAVQIAAYSVDELAHRYGCPDVLYIDVEGYELEILRGASETLAHRPDCCIEVHVGVGLEECGASAEKILEHFPEREYQLLVSIADQNDAFHSLSKIPEQRFHLIALSKSF
jgi:FkbM family methyltransferase